MKIAICTGILAAAVIWGYANRYLFLQPVYSLNVVSGPIPVCRTTASWHVGNAPFLIGFDESVTEAWGNERSESFSTVVYLGNGGLYFNGRRWRAGLELFIFLAGVPAVSWLVWTEFQERRKRPIQAPPMRPA